MGAIAAKIAGNTANSPATGSVTLGDLAPLATFSVIGNQTGTSSTPTAVAMNCIPGLRSQATAAGTTTLVNTDVLEQVFTGVTTQTVVLPVVTTLKQAGWQYLIINDSSGAVTINSSGSNAVQVVAAGARCLVSNNKITADTTAAAWEVVYVPVVSTAITDGDGNPITSNAIYDNVQLAKSAADATARLALTGLTRGARVYQTDTGFWYELTNAAAPSDAASWQGIPKKYVAVLTQSGTDAPVATVQENSIGAIVWTRDSAGLYDGTLASAFTADKTWAMLQNLAWDGAANNYLLRSTGNAVRLSIAAGDGYLDSANPAVIEILVYPT